MMAIVAASPSGLPSSLATIQDVWAFLQVTAGTAPLPAEPPIGGSVWTIVIPAFLFVGSFLGTYFLYRRFSRVESQEEGIP